MFKREQTIREECHHTAKKKNKTTRVNCGNHLLCFLFSFLPALVLLCALSSLSNLFFDYYYWLLFYYYFYHYLNAHNRVSQSLSQTTNLCVGVALVNREFKVLARKKIKGGA